MLQTDRKCAGPVLEARFAEVICRGVMWSGLWDLTAIENSGSTKQD